MSLSVEIERKYIIEKPNASDMSAMPSYTKSEICQIYLESDRGVTHRIRSRKLADRIVYTETVKKRIDKISSYEDEREISESEFFRLSSEIDKESRPVLKIRHSFLYLDKLIEIDIYPEWEYTAIMETELSSRGEEVILPSFIKIKREVSGIRAYSNASMSRSFPREDN